MSSAMSSQEGNPKQLRFTRVLFYLIPGLIISAILAFNILQPIKVLPRVSLAPGFAFINQDGETVTSEDYRGRLVFYTFSFSECGKPCEATGSKLARLDKELTAKNFPGLDISFVTISLDPENETPSELQAVTLSEQLAQTLTNDWDFVAGASDLTKYVVGGGFGVYYDNLQAMTQAASFEPRVVLVDGWGIIRSEYHPESFSVERALTDIDYLANEIENANGVAKLAYEAAHLFRCYP